MKKKLICVVVVLVLIAILPYVYVEVKTAIYYEQTVDLYQETNMISSDNYHKVISYSQKEAKILYCEPNTTFLCCFYRDEDNKWICENFEPILYKGGFEDTAFYPIYPTKDFIFPKESKENFDEYEKIFRSFAQKKNLDCDVVYKDNNIDRDIKLNSESCEIVLSFFNDYDGLSGCEAVEITCSFNNTVTVDVGLFEEIQELCIHKPIQEKAIIDFIDSNLDETSASSKVKEKYPIFLDIKSKDLLGNGEYIISYIKTDSKNILCMEGLTKRNMN